jgi:hypothetical protein
MDRNQFSVEVDRSAPAGAGSRGRAAKLQVLGLAPLKQRLGPRWERLSGLVHKLFETAIARVQGPHDHCIAVDELSYVVTFRHLSMAETDLACVSIAKEVCRMLFGNQIDEISVRSLVAAICMPVDPDKTQWGKQIEAMLEESGTETVVTQSAHAGSREPVISIAGQVQKPSLPATQAIAHARTSMERLGLKLALFPVWELRKNTSSALLLFPWSSVGRTPVSGRRALEGMNPSEIADTEIMLLNSAAACAMRIHEAEKICAVGVGVSYATLSVFHTRIRYVTALQKIRVPPSVAHTAQDRANPSRHPGRAHCGACRDDSLSQPAADFGIPESCRDAGAGDFCGRGRIWRRDARERRRGPCGVPRREARTARGRPEGFCVCGPARFASACERGL